MGSCGAGHWHGAVGIANHDGWVTSHSTPPDLDPSAWILSTDTMSKAPSACLSTYSANGVNRTTNAAVCDVNAAPLYINSGYMPGGSYEPSDWAVAELRVYDVVLSVSEISEIEAALLAQYITPPSPPPGQRGVGMPECGLCSAASCLHRVDVVSAAGARPTARDFHASRV